MVKRLRAHQGADMLLESYKPNTKMLKNKNLKIKWNRKPRIDFIKSLLAKEVSLLNLVKQR